MNFKYLALGILVGYLAPYAITLIKAKKDSENSFQSRSIYRNDDEQNSY